MELSRRDVLKLGVLSSAALLLPIERFARTESASLSRLSSSQLPARFTQKLPVYGPVAPTATALEGGHDYAFYNMQMRQSAVDILGNGKLTNIWGYNGITPGPTISVKQGTQTVVRHYNNMEGVNHATLGYKPVTSVHLHGSCSLPEYDGYASDTTAPGFFKDYHYPNVQDARTLWYHDHGVHETASNAYMGLAAQYHLHDDNEINLVTSRGLPAWAYDIPLTVRDAIFSTSGQLIYDDNSESQVMGDVVLVNGKPWPIMEVEPRKYRFRILNASVSRSYKFALTDSPSAKSEQYPMTVIATDGGLMPKPQMVRSFRHGMAERYEIVIDFAQFAGKKVYLQNLGLPNNANYDSTLNVMAFSVTKPKSGTPDIDAVAPVLNPNMDVMELDKRYDPSKVRNRKFELVRQNGSWTVNGTTWINVLNSNYQYALADPAPGDVEVWEIKNGSGGWFHPFHIHLVDFKILSRNGRAPFAYELGPKDVVYVGENETVRVMLALRGPDNPVSKAHDAEYGPRTGRYMMHCHNLVHEDHDMMGQFWVKASGTDVHHPVDAAAALPIGDAGTIDWLHNDHFKSC